MEKEYDNGVVEYWQILGIYDIAKFIRDEEIDNNGFIEDTNTMPLKLGVFM